MKNAAPEEGGRRGADVAGLPVVAPLPFRIVRFETCDFHAKRAVGVFEIEGLGRIEFEYFRPSNGRQPFVTAKSTLSKYTGRYERAIRLDDDFARELREAIEARLATEHDESH